MLEKYIKNPKIRGLAEWLLAAALAFLAYLFLSSYVYATAEVSGPSMNPTLHHGERAIINKLIYIFGAPEKGDIIAFPYPSNPVDKHVKRIIGVPGDYIEVYDNKLFVNGELLEDDFSESDLVSVGDVAYPITVGEDEYFVLGDNRNNSKDSRSSSVGLIQRENIIGKIWIRFFPFDKVGFVK